MRASASGGERPSLAALPVWGRAQQPLEAGFGPPLRLVRRVAIPLRMFAFWLPARLAHVLSP